MSVRKLIFMLTDVEFLYVSSTLCVLEFASVYIAVQVLTSVPWLFAVVCGSVSTLLRCVCLIGSVILPIQRTLRGALSFLFGVVLTTQIVITSTQLLPFPGPYPEALSVTYTMSVFSITLQGLCCRPR